MRERFRKTVALVILCALLITMPVFPVAASGKSSGKSGTSKPVLQKKPTINLAKMSTYDKSGKAKAAALKIAQKYYGICSPKIETKLKFDFTTLTGTVGKVTFDGKMVVDEGKATELSNAATVASLSPDAQNFSLTLACVAFAKAPNKNVAAHNMAAVINVRASKSGIALEKTFAKGKADAATIYEYAVSLDPKNADTLVNLGNVYIDLNRQEDARIMFEAALKLIPRYHRAREGMAAYWLARGDKKRAAKELEGNNILLPGVMRKAAEESKVINDPKKAPIPNGNDSLEKLKQDIDTLKQLKLVSTADFIEDFDPIDAQEIRLKINNLPETDRLTLPKITSIAEVSSYEKYYKDADKFNGYEKQLGAFFKPWSDDLSKRQQQTAKDALEGLGIKLDGNGKPTVPSKLDLTTLQNQIKDAQKGLKNGDYSALQALVGKSDPEIADTIGPLKSGESPISRYTRWYNMQVFIRKRNAYFMYFMKYNKKYMDLIQADKTLAGKKIDELRKEEAAEIKKLEDQKASQAEIDKVKIEYGLKRNKERENWFHNDFDLMVYQYINVFKPQMDAAWADLMPHVRLIKQDKSRNKWYADISSMALTNSMQFLGLTLASASVDGQWDNVTEQDLEAALEKIRQEYAQKAAEDVKEANTPKGVTLGDIIDKLKIDYSCGPIKVKITADSIEVSGAALLAAAIKFNWTQGTFSGGVGVGVRVGAEADGVGVKAEAITMLTYNMDLKTGNVTEIDWKGNVGATGKVGGVLKLGDNYEASVMHGNHLDSQVTATYANVATDIGKSGLSL